ncbi:hexosaminidase D-like [Periplaneta americana]|uniref:hexosaminidase D-like n=1 Tax=Periplaneta americana TaxID=6978 RepID=UPI0037E988A5
MGLAASYAGRLGLTAWRRKSTLLGLAAGLVLLVLCLQYNAASRPEPAKLDDSQEPTNDDKSPLQRTLRNHQEGAAKLSNDLQLPRLSDPEGGGNALDDGDALKQSLGGENVKFVQADAKVPLVTSSHPEAEDAAPKNQFFSKAILSMARIPAEQPGREEVAGRKAVIEQFGGDVQRAVVEASTPGLQPVLQYNSYDQQGLYQMGIPYVNLDPRRPYVPEQRLVHFDLKGAPPKVSYLKRLFPLVRQLGATGVLLEWEDMFPFTGPLASIAAGNSYSRRDVDEILTAARGSELEVIPLVQTFGHVEFALKHPEFESLREVPESPQALCPSLNASMDFVEKMIEQVMEVHQGARFLHIGCDEVFQMGECRRCRSQMRETLFLSHVARVASFVRNRYGAVTPIIWDDMLRHLSPQSLEEFRIGELVEPMVWVYAEDVYRFVPSMVWDKFAAVFPYVWSASAFKGAFGETLYIPNVKRHLENNLRWLEVMSAEGPKFKGGFRGIAITGWQRYDHFAVLCELLPAAVPSLAVNLLATSHGYFNQSLKGKLQSSLGCARPGSPASSSSYSRTESIVNLNSDPYLWDKFGRCFFPGAPFFKLTYRLHAAEIEVKEFLDSVMKSKGWMTDYNIRRKYSSPLRVDELMGEHPRVYHTLTALARSARDALDDVFDSYTIAEWVEQRIYPDIQTLEQLQRDSLALKSVHTWSKRPLPPLRDLKRLGVPMPEDDDVTNTNSTPQISGK